MTQRSTRWAARPMGPYFALLPLLLFAHGAAAAGPPATGPTAPAAERVFPGEQWAAAAPAAVGLDPGRLAAARDYALTGGGGSGMVVRGGRLAIAWGDPKARYDLKSSTKSFGAIALGLAVADGKVSLDDPAVRHHPGFASPPADNLATGWVDRVTLYHLATQTAGFEKPGGYGRLLFPPGTRWRYSDAGPNWLAECLTLAYRRDLDAVMAERVFRPIGVGPADLVWRANPYRDKQIDGLARREFGAGISADVDAMARVGLLMLRGGRWGDRQILPPAFVARCGRPQPDVAAVAVDPPVAGEYGGASAHYGLLWWNNGDGALRGVPTDAYWSWGLYDSLIVVVPSLDLVAARAGRGWRREPGAAHYAVLAPFLEPLCAAAAGPATATQAATGPAEVPATGPAAPPATIPATRPAAGPPPPSPVIRGIRWDPADAIAPQAAGSDNWPMTWADDGHQYVAFGDGWGFQRTPGEPKVSVGVAWVEGDPPAARGVDIPAPTIEAVGGGAKGVKASGLLCADGVLYLWLRNAGNSRLAWSADHGRTWAKADWRLAPSFGCPTFVNAGQNYADARDGFVYVCSPDADDAYHPADRMVMARVPTARLRDRSAYAFFAGLSPAGAPAWSPDVADRAAVLSNPGRCYRSNVTYAPGLGRYLWMQTVPAAGVVGDGAGGGGDGGRPAAAKPAGPTGLVIYDALDPWGPWTMAYSADRWDVDPGDSAGLPAKWLSVDGRSAYLVYAGGDAFRVRRLTFDLAAGMSK
jgi:CubicO group peptidase (beta-lactamase class C family)